MQKRLLYLHLNTKHHKKSSPVVYFDQCLGDAHSKRWLKYIFSNFLHLFARFWCKNYGLCCTSLHQNLAKTCKKTLKRDNSTSIWRAAHKRWSKYTTPPPPYLCNINFECSLLFIVHLASSRKIMLLIILDPSWLLFKFYCCLSLPESWGAHLRLAELLLKS